MNITPPVIIGSNGSCLIDGNSYNAVGFGTYPFKGEVCINALERAIECGYRIIDTATYYHNFEPISDVIKKHERSDFYLISKVWPLSHTHELLKEDLHFTLENLQIDCLDAYFLHWPNSKIPLEETLSTLEEFRAQKLIRHIGMSNVTVNHLKRALELNIPITWIQVEMSPFYYDPELLSFCQDNHIVVQAWGPLGRGRIDKDTLLTHLSTKYHKTSSQIAIRWIIQNGCLPLPGSKNPQHIKNNIDVMDFILSTEDMALINQQASQGQRERVTLDKGTGFADEFDYSYEECWPK